MAPQSPLDRLLDNYLASAIRNASAVTCAGKTLAYVKFAGEDVTGQGDCNESALISLRETIRQRVFRAMNRGAALPVLAGIDITPGSC